MEVPLAIQDDKATTLKEALKDLPYAEAKQPTDSKAEWISDIR